MTNLARKPPLGQKVPQPGSDPKYLADVRRLPCVICDAFGEIQLSPTTAHHWICGRGQGRRTPDREAIPLCDGHHQGDFDTSKTAIHRDRSEWVRKYGNDHEYIEVTQDRVAEMRGE